MEILRGHGLDIPEFPICYFDFSSPEDARETLNRFLENSSRFDAVLCYSDFHAAFVYDHCRTRGIRIPDDLAVMGIGCYTGWDLLSPKLTTLDFHYEKIAATTADWLENPPPPRTFRLWESEIHPGKSTAAPFKTCLKHHNNILESAAAGGQ
jgi:DNA-binding LacI/PurR family transcriptional regulator